MIKLSFITDEATQSFEQAVSFACKYGLQGVELRSVEDKPIDEIDHDTLRQYRAVLDKNGLRVCNLAGSFYKCDRSSRSAVEQNLKKLVRLCDAADILGCDTLRGFAFFAPDSGPEPAHRLVPYFKEPARILHERGKTLLLEADPSVNTSNHQAVAQLLSLLNEDCFGAIYDPGNDLYDPLKEIPYPNGYDAVKKYMKHIHIKDTVYDALGMPQCVCVGEGLVGYEALLRRLLQDGYNGWLSLETHYRKDVVLTEEQMRVPQGSTFSAGGMEAAAESVLALRRLLENAEKERVEYAY